MEIKFAIWTRACSMDILIELKAAIVSNVIVALIKGLHLGE